MRIPTWRLVLTGGAVALLAIAGIELAAASGAPGAPAANVVTAEQTGGPDTEARGQSAEPRVRDGLRGDRLLRAGRRLVHAEMTVTGRDGKLIHLQFDHGTVQSIGGGKIKIAEAGGGTEIVSTDAATIVRVGRADGELGDLTVGMEVFVQSRLDGDSALAKRILVLPAAGT